MKKLLLGCLPLVTLLFSASSASALMMSPDEVSKPMGWGMRTADRKFNEAATAVAGPVRLRVRAVGANISVVAGPPQLLSVRATAADATRVELRKESADSYEVLFDGNATLRNGHVVATVPPKSEIEIQTTTGSISVSALSGIARVRSTVGDISIVRGGQVEARSISGHVTIIDADGETRIDTVSGPAQVSALRGVTPTLRFASTSGALDWSGGCGSRCRIEARTMSGPITLRLRKESSFGLRFLSHSGDLDDRLGIATSSGNTDGEVMVAAKYNEGLGSIEANTWSGHLTLTP